VLYPLIFRGQSIIPTKLPCHKIVR